MDLRNLTQKALGAGLGGLLLTQAALLPARAEPVAEPMAMPAEAPVEAPAAGNRIPWQGGSFYLTGANVPWFSWGCDFGCGARGGVSDPAVRAQLDPGFASLATSGVKVLRWWVFEGEAWQISRDGSGTPTGVNPQVFADMDVALQLAEQHDLYYSFTLFHGQSNLPREWLTDPAKRARLVDALVPLFARYRGNPRLLSWDVMNEPEWDVWENKIAKEPLQALVKEVAAAVHQHSTAYVTVGSAMLDGLPMWTGLGLDYYQAHWYDYMNGGNWCARCTDYASVQQRYGLDRPLIIGEFWAGKETDTTQRLADWRAKGYAGAYAWSFFADKTQDKLNIDLAAMRAFTAQHADEQLKLALAATSPIAAEAQG